MSALLAAVTLPLEDPILKFMLIMAIVLVAPLLLNRLRIPSLLGLIIAGAVIGPHGLNLMLRDSSIILSGTAGLLYIMFQSGLEIDIDDLRRNSFQSGAYGLLTTFIPMAAGYLTGCAFGYSFSASMLIGALFAAQTLIAYPIVSRLGIARDRAVTLAVGGTVIADLIALLVLTVIANSSTGSMSEGFWWRLGGSVAACVGVILFLFPFLSRLFFKFCSDHVSQYVFVLVMVFLGAFLAQAAGLEPIIGAFLTGLAMNRLIPRTSPLMNRIEFVGSAVFIPFFLIGVGMLIDFRAFFQGWDTLIISAVMILLSTAAKYAAALITQKSFHLSRDQRTLLFGLSNAHVAATLAAVMVGYGIVLGTSPDGTPIRLLDERILNATILMIFISCTIASFATQRGAHNLALTAAETDEAHTDGAEGTRILIPVAYPETVEELVNLSMMLKDRRLKTGLHALTALANTVETAPATGAVKRAQKLLDAAVRTAAAADNPLQPLLRYDVNVANAIRNAMLELQITDLVVGLHHEHGMLDSFLGATTAHLLSHSNTTTFIYRSVQPLATVRRHVVTIPSEAEKEAGFLHWVARLWHVARNTGTRMEIHASRTTIGYIDRAAERRPVNVSFRPFEDEEGFVIPAVSSIRANDCLWIVMSRRERISWHALMGKVPYFIDNHFAENNLVMIYPEQAGGADTRFIA